jgi:hypothetical protein
MTDYTRAWRRAGHPDLYSTEQGEITLLDFTCALTNRGATQARARARGCSGRGRLSRVCAPRRVTRARAAAAAAATAQVMQVLHRRERARIIRAAQDLTNATVTEATKFLGKCHQSRQPTVTSARPRRPRCGAGCGRKLACAGLTD